MFTRARLIEHYPEFASASPALLDRVLAEAWDELDPATWLARRDTAHGLLTACKLARGQFSQNAMLAEQAKAWQEEFDRQLAAATALLRSF